MAVDIQSSEPDPRDDAPGSHRPQHALWHWQPASDTLTIAADAARLLACSPAELPVTGAALLERIATPFRGRLEQALQDARDRGAGFDLRLGWVGRDGSLTMVCLDGMAVNAGTSVVVCGAVTAAPPNVDMPAVPAERMAALLHDRASDGIVVVDGQGRCLQANPAALLLLGVDEQHLCGAQLSEVLGLPAETFVDSQESSSVETTFPITVNRGERGETLLELRPLGQAERGLRILNLRDISERRDSERLHALLGAIVDSTDDAIIGKDLNGIIQFWNNAAERLFGYRPEEAIGRHITLLIPDQRHDEEGVIISRIRRGERVEHYETIRRTKDGRLVNISLSVSPIIDQQGTVIGASKIARDITRQKQIEALSRSNRELLRTVVDAAPVAVILVDANGMVHLWNPTATRMFGWTEAQITAPISAPGSPQKEALLAELRGLALGDPARGIETAVVRKDGTLAEISLWSTDLQEVAQEPDRTLFLAADISDRRRAQRALREQEQRLHAALRASRTGTFRWDIQTNDLQWDENLDRLFGVAPGESVRSLNQFLDRVHPDDRDAVADRLRRSATEGSDFEMDLRVVWPDDTVRWIYDVGQTLRDRHNRPDYMTGACVDITQRKQAEQALRDSESRFRTLADNIAQFAWMADGEGWIFWYNKRWFDYTGTTLEQMQGWGWRQVHHPDHVDRVVEKVSRCFATGTVWEDTFPLRAADGSYRWFLSRAVPIRGEDGQVTRWFGTNTDITERRNMEESLKEADRRKDAFLATLAHELRNPLAPIVNGLELLRIVGNDPSKAQRIRETMERQTSHLKRLVDDLLEVSRISRNKVQLRLEEVTLQHLVTSAIEAVQPLIDSLRHTLEVDIPERPVMLRADPTRVAQVFANLLNNAAKYTEPGGTIVLKAQARDEQLTVTISDNGCGIAANMLEPIFDMFTQTSALETGRGGLGIGLTLVRALVELHGGNIRAYSGGLGTGSEFVLTLPVIHQPAHTISTTTSPGAETMASTSPQRILVVDDNEDAAVSTAMLLEAMGNEVRTAYDGEEALGIASDFRPQVILLDLGMPKLNGYEAARRLRQAPWGQDMVLIALTGWGQEQDRQRTQEAGFDHHLVKPVDPSALRGLLGEIAGDSSQS